MKYAFLTIAIIIGTASSINTAYSAGHLYNGATCYPSFGKQASSFEHLPNGIKNVSNGSRWVTCPVLRDDLNSEKGTQEIWVYWNAYKIRDRIKCNFRSQRFRGTPVQTTTITHEGGGLFQIPNITRSAIWGTYSLYCFLPMKSTINSFRVVEPE